MTTTDPARNRAARHSREDVVAAALDILDRHGLPDLTMRRLATTLDVQPSALYWHVANKQSLLAAIADQIIARARVAPVVDGDTWIVRAATEADALRDALLAFRDGAEVVSSTLALGLGAEEALTRLTDAITLGGFDRDTSSTAAAAMLHFVLGHVSHEQQRIQADSLGVVSGAIAAHPNAVNGRSADSFAFGIGLLLSGLEQRSRTDAREVRSA